MASWLNTRVTAENFFSNEVNRNRAFYDNSNEKDDTLSRSVVREIIGVGLNQVSEGVNICLALQIFSIGI